MRNNQHHKVQPANRMTGIKDSLAYFVAITRLLTALATIMTGMSLMRLLMTADNQKNEACLHCLDVHFYAALHNVNRV